jgi:hypothetical protein
MQDRAYSVWVLGKIANSAHKLLGQTWLFSEAIIEECAFDISSTELGREITSIVWNHGSRDSIVPRFLSITCRNVSLMYKRYTEVFVVVTLLVRAALYIQHLALRKTGGLSPVESSRRIACYSGFFDGCSGHCRKLSHLRRSPVESWFGEVYSYGESSKDHNVINLMLALRVVKKAYVQIGLGCKEFSMESFYKGPMVVKAMDVFMPSIFQPLEGVD